MEPTGWPSFPLITAAEPVLKKENKTEFYDGIMRTVSALMENAPSPWGTPNALTGRIALFTGTSKKTSSMIENLEETFEQVFDWLGAHFENPEAFWPCREEILSELEGTEENRKKYFSLRDRFVNTIGNGKSMMSKILSGLTIPRNDCLFYISLIGKAWEKVLEVGLEAHPFGHNIPITRDSYEILETALINRGRSLERRISKSKVYLYQEGSNPEEGISFEICNRIRMRITPLTIKTWKDDG